MASKTLPSSSGYFNKKMLSILEQGEKQAASKKKPASGGSGKSVKRK